MEVDTLFLLALAGITVYALNKHGMYDKKNVTASKHPKGPGLYAKAPKSGAPRQVQNGLDLPDVHYPPDRDMGPTAADDPLLAHLIP